MHSSNLLAVLHSLLKTGRAGIVLQLELSWRNNGTPELPTVTPGVRQQVRLQSTPRRTRCRGGCQCDEMTEIVLHSLLLQILLPKHQTMLRSLLQQITKN